VTCDETFDDETPANVEDVLTGTTQYLKMNITQRIELKQCSCCSVSLSDKSDLKICNRVCVLELSISRNERYLIMSV
jgi:hypothetical protein